MTKSKKNASEIKALSLPEISALKQQATVIVPRGAYTSGETIELIEDDIRTTILITKLIERSSSFERYQYSLI